MVRPKANSAVNPTESSALAARGSQNQPSNNQSRKGGRPWCDHCRKLGHTKETCWKIHEKPADWKPSRAHGDKKSRGNQASIEDHQVSSSQKAPLESTLSARNS